MSKSPAVSQNLLFAYIAVNWPHRHVMCDFCLAEIIRRIFLFLKKEKKMMSFYCVVSIFLFLCFPWSLWHHTIILQHLSVFFHNPLYIVSSIPSLWICHYDFLTREDPRWTGPHQQFLGPFNQFYISKSNQVNSQLKTFTWIKFLREHIKIVSSVEEGQQNLTPKCDYARSIA